MYSISINFDLQQQCSARGNNVGSNDLYSDSGVLAFIEIACTGRLPAFFRIKYSAFILDILFNIACKRIYPTAVPVYINIFFKSLTRTEHGGL